MTATDELRALLDERGVKYETNEDERDLIAEPERTAWEYIQCGYEMYVVATEAVDVEGKPYLDMDFHHYHTPEQAIAATLGGERERELELLVKQLWYLVNHRSGYGYAAALESIEELGIEVDE